MRRIALINQKGGVGKTTTAVNLGACLAAAGRRVLLVDLDPQANLTLHMGLQPKPGAATSYRVLLGERPVAEAIHATGTEGLSVIPTDIDLSGAELELASAFGRETLLRDAISAWCDEDPTGNPVDYLIYDCPPSLGLLAVNGLAAAEEVLLPVQTEFFALQGLTKLMDTVGLVQRRIQPGLTISGIIACLYDNRLRLAREVLGELRRYFPGKVFRQAIGTNVKLAEAPSFGKTILEYAPESAGAKDYRALALEVIALEPQPEVTDPQAALAQGSDGPLAAPVVAPKPVPRPALRPVPRAATGSAAKAEATRAAKTPPKGPKVPKTSAKVDVGSAARVAGGDAQLPERPPAPERSEPPAESNPGSPEHDSEAVPTRPHAAPPPLG